MSSQSRSKQSYHLLAIQLKVLLGWHLVSLGLIRVRRINALGHVGKDLLRSEHTIGIEPGAIVDTIGGASSGARSKGQGY